MRVLLPCCLVLGLLCLVLPARAQFFPDVPDGTLLARDVTDAAYHQLMEGYPDGAFRPNAPLTRADAVMVYARLLNIALRGFMVLPGTGDAQMPRFTDISEKHWMRAAAAFLTQHGMLHPAAGNRFRPAQPVRRGEFIVELYRLQHAGTVVTPPEAMAWLDERGLLPTGWTALEAPVTRGEVARALGDLLLYLTQHAMTEGTITAIEAERDGLRWVKLDTIIGPCRLAMPVRGVTMDGVEELREGMMIRTISDAVNGGGKSYYRVRKVTPLGKTAKSPSSI
jgi:hypothetical protein